MRKKKTRLSKKLLLAFLGSIVCIVMAVTLVGSLFSMFWSKEIMVKAMYVSQVIILISIIIAFYYICDRLIVRRIQELNDAMKKVANGDYEITVNVNGNDELSTLTESFNAMSNELKLNAFLSKDFARYVSHEFKTPLSVIRNYAEITQYDSSQSETEKNMEIIISESDRLAGLSKDILELCKLDSTTIIEKKDRFSPAAQIRSVILDLQLLWGVKEIEIIPELDEFEIVSNEALLFRVWQNIIGNAVKFTEQHGQISVLLKKNEGGFVCEISDNGIGISDEDKEHIFTPFYTGKRSHGKEGSGLGLSLSKKIIEKLDGTVEFQSELGKGTTFTVTVPC
ncbi:MAG: ATP-binding protein [Oscillospiraceae bacterium]